MTGRSMARRRHSQARRVRRLEMERPTVRAVVRGGASWAALNTQRLPGMALALASLVVAGLLFADPRFYVYGAQVSGNHVVPSEAIYEASGADMHSVFFLSPSTMRRQLLEALPALADARVSIDLPSRLCIRVDEKIARFVWEAGDQSYLVDSEGTILGGAGAPDDAFRVHCTEGDLPAVGGKFDPDVLAAIEELSQLLGGVRLFDYSARYGVCWQNGRGWLVRFGVAGDLARKVAVMQSLSAELTDQGIEPQFLDVGNPSRPYYQRR